MSSKQSMSFAQEAPKTEPWVRVGSAFTAKNGEGFNILIGNKIKKDFNDPNGKYEETVKELVLIPGSKLYMSPAKGKDGNLITTKHGAQVYRLTLKPYEEPEDTVAKKEEVK